MLKSKMICGRKSAWVYKNFEMEKNLFIRTKHCVLSFNCTHKREAALFYQYLFYIMLDTLVVLSHICAHIAEIWKGIGTFQIKYKKMYEWLQ